MSTKLNIISVYASYDPTKTSTLRNAFVKDSNRRFNELATAVSKAIIQQDVFGLKKKKPMVFVAVPIAGAFNFAKNQEKVSKFMEWIQAQVDSGILDIKDISQVGSAIDGAWTNKYVYDSYKRGVQRARYEMKAAGFDIPPLDENGLTGTMQIPVNLDRIGMLYTRTFSDLKGITEQMDNLISKTLAQGLVDGDGAKLLAGKLTSLINGTGETLAIKDSLGRYISASRRAEIMARTEIIRAHHLGNVQEMRNWGAEGVKVQAEFMTSGDNRVCSQCESLAKQGPYTLDQIQYMIPVHPQCRCVALPIPLGQDTGKVSSSSEDVPTGIPMPENMYQWAKDNNITFSTASPPTEYQFNQMFVTTGEGMNIAELDAEMSAIADKYGFKFNMRKIYGEGSDMNIMYSGEFEGQVIEIKRYFYNKNVTHSLFDIPPALQGKGMSKDVLQAFYKQYKNMNLNNIKIHANKDVGGYAWARYGFQMENKQDILFFIDDISQDTVTKDLARRLVDDFYKNRHINTPFPMNLISDTSWGKNFLLKSDWNGFLDLSNSDAVKRFEDYLFRKK